MTKTPPGAIRLDETQPCSDYRWSHMPGKALRDPVVMARFKCRQRGRWEYRGQVLCWSHVWAKILSPPFPLPGLLKEPEDA